LAFAEVATRSATAVTAETTVFTEVAARCALTWLKTIATRCIRTVAVLTAFEAAF
jgi:hypothetical protein